MSEKSSPMREKEMKKRVQPKFGAGSLLKSHKMSDDEEQ